MNREFENWVFDCPYHGWEYEIFCFRASNVEFADKWHKFKVTWQEETTFPHEREAFQRGFIERMR